MEWVDADYWFELEILNIIGPGIWRGARDMGIVVLVSSFVVIVGFFVARRMLRRVRQSV